MKNRYILIILILASLLLTFIFTFGTNISHFLFIHDEFLILSKNESINSLFVLNPLDLGTDSMLDIIVTFFERIYFSIIYSLNIPFHISQVVLYFIKLLILMLLPYIGLEKLYKTFHKTEDKIIPFLISIWYSFNTFTLIYWQGNAFSLTLLICYCLAPLGFYMYQRSIFKVSSIKYKLLTAMIFFLMSFAVYFFVVFLIFLFIYTIIEFILNKHSLQFYIKNLFILFIVYIPFLSTYMLIIYSMFFGGENTVNAVGGSTYEMLSGGILNQILMWFSWGIYTYWSPKNIFSFNNYFYTLQSLVAPFCIYILVFKNITRIFTSSIMALVSSFLVFLFLIKGSQPPLGGVYLFLLKYIPLFRVFRSPDDKFGFGIVLVLSILLLSTSSTFGKRIFITLMLFTILIQGFFIFNGVAVKGQDTTHSSNRVISIPAEYWHLSDYINNKSMPYGYILPFPQTSFGNFQLNGKLFIGQDILPKIINLPFLYFSEYSGMSESSYQSLSKSIKDKNITKLNIFPIRYFLIRNDFNVNSSIPIESEIAKSYPLVYQNKYFRLYENSSMTPEVEARNGSFIRQSPVMYYVNVPKDSKDMEIQLNQNYNSNWLLYPADPQSCPESDYNQKSKTFECKSNKNSLFLSGLTYLFKPPLQYSHHVVGSSYANKWIIGSSDIKKLPTMFSNMSSFNNNYTFVIFYKTQAYLIAGIIISFTYFISLLLYMFFVLIKQIKIYA